MKKSILLGFALLLAAGSVWAQQYLITTVAGGKPSLRPSNVAVDRFGDVFFKSGTCVWAVDRAGAVTCVAGSPTNNGYSGDGGRATNALLSTQGKVAVDAAGNLYIADTNNFVIRKVTPKGTISTVASTKTTFGGAFPSAVAVDAKANLYIVIASRIGKVTPDGTATIAAGDGSWGYSGDGGPATSAQLNGPSSVVADSSGNLFIADSGNNRIRKVTQEGAISTVAGNGVHGYSGDGGPATGADLAGPSDVAVDAAGNLYIADSGNNRIRKVTPDGAISTVAGNGALGLSGDGGPATSAPLDYPIGVAIDAAGSLYVAVVSGIRKVTPDGIISTIAGSGVNGHSGDGGPAVGARLNAPQGVAVDAAGNFYIADTSDNEIRKVTPNGTISTVAGTGAAGFSGDGGPATSAQLSSPGGVAVDASGNLYVVDTGNNRLRKVAEDGTISTVAGTGTAGYSGDGGPATSAQLHSPASVALSAAGDIYVADTANGAIRKVGSDGVISTVARNLSGAYSVAVDSAGNLYVTDYSASTCSPDHIHVRYCAQADVLKVTPGGAVSTVPGTVASTLYQTFPQAYEPGGVATDASGNLYISYSANSLSYGVILKVAVGGAVARVAGIGGQLGYSGDGGLATSALLNQPMGLAVDSTGGVYFADSQNHAIRLLVPQGTRPLLSVAIARTADFLGQGQTAATYSAVVSNAAGASPTSGPVTVTEIVPTGLTLVSMSGAGWDCSGNACTRSDVLNPGSSYPGITVTMNVAPDAPHFVSNQVTVSGGGAAPAGASDVVSILPRPATPLLISPANGASGIVMAPALSWNPVSGAASYDVYFGASSAPAFVTNTTATSYAPGTLQPGARYHWQVIARNDIGTASSAIWSFTTGSPAVGLRFVPVTPCRVADTRGAAGRFGGPALAPFADRSFAIPQSACGIPATAQAYSLNLTVVPRGPVAFLTVWPTGQPQPFVSTLNAADGTVVANAAIVPAGAAGAVSVYASAENPTDVILDINGYFDLSNGTHSSAFYPVTPCRVADTRGATGTFGGPTVSANQVRDFPIPLSPCGIPPAASAYSFNVTVVPEGPLPYLTLWPTGQARPTVSTLNSWTGKVVANAAIVPVGDNESVSVFVKSPTDVILDASGYFAPPGNTGALLFYPVKPCRVADTREPAGPFGAPILPAATTRSFTIPASVCNIPTTAAAYSLNVTVVPEGPLSYLTAWPTGAPRPVVSTLNSFEGNTVANAAIIPAGVGGAVTIFVTNPTQVILDINGYFAQ